jgi:hypothetical protein
LETRIHVFVTAHMDVPMSGWGVSNDPADEPPSDRFRYRYLNSVTGRCTIQDEAGLHSVNLEEIAQAVRDLCMATPGGIGATWIFVKLPP